MSRHVQVVKTFTGKTGRARVPGELLTLSDEEAQKLIDEGVVKAHEAPHPTETKSPRPTETKVEEPEEQKSEGEDEDERRS